MVDERLRELERRWSESGALEDEVKLLRERVRLGLVDARGLEFAAYLDHSAARRLLGEDAPAPIENLEALDPKWRAWGASLLEGLEVEEPRIWFPGNPWPAGHALQEVTWGGRLDGEGLRFELRVQSADYYADDGDQEEEDEEPESDWLAKIVWGNYHACHIEGGFPLEAAPDLRRSFSFHHLDPELPEDFDDHLFATYLLGHDSVADHHLRFAPVAGGHALRWDGKIALTYAGDEELRYRFWAQIPRLRFDGFKVTGVTEEQALEFLAAAVPNPEDYEIRREGGWRWFSPPGSSGLGG